MTYMNWVIPLFPNLLYTIALCTLYAPTCSVQYSETSCRIQVWFIKSHSLHYLFICIWGVKSTLIQLTKQKSSSNKRKENNHHFPPELVTFCFRWSHYTPPHSHHPLTWLPTSVSQFLCLLLTAFPAQRSASNPFAHITNSSPIWSWQWNLWHPQLRPAISFSVVPTMFGYTPKFESKP